jgi:glycosyltransferase involved in cell wall biosynthesis
VRLISLATSANDSASVLLRRPSTWWRGIATTADQINNEWFTHVGASFSELEFRRYAPRRELYDLLAECDLVQVVGGAPAWALPVVGCGKPIVLQVATLTKFDRVPSNNLPIRLIDLWRRLMTRVTMRYDEAGLRAANVIMVENDWMFNYARGATRESGNIVRHAPPGVDIDLFHPDVMRDFSNRERYILAVGRVSDPRKNVALLLKAFVRVRQTVEPPPCLLIVSPHDPGPAFWNKVNALGLQNCVSLHVNLRQRDLAQIYREAVCFVLSSDEEGFGMVVIEAMASGIPVVATRCGGPDRIITDGVDGFLVPLGDAAALGDQVAVLAGNDDLNREMGRNARKTVESRYSEEVAGRAFLEVYHNLLSSTTR